MAIRYDDAEKRILLSVRDLVEEERRGSLGLAVVQSLQARAAAGRRIHTSWQLERSGEDAAFRAEVSVRRPIPVDDWTVELFGRVDGLSTEGDHSVVEEVKSSALDARRLHGTTLDDWPSWVDQLRVYLWMLQESGHQHPVGRLVVVSVYDGSRQVLGVAHDHAAIGLRIRRRAEDLVRERSARVAWMQRRRSRTPPDPFDAWRPGQREIVEAVHWGLDAGNTVLVEAPTGLGKTAAALAGALRHALATDRQVFFATARTTQQPGIVRALATFAARGLPLRSLVLRARAKACLQEVVDCRPEVCRYAADYYDKLRAAGLPGGLLTSDVHVDARALEDAARVHVVCPYELGLDAGPQLDVVIGDYNYALEPGVRLERLFGGDGARGFVLVVDEVHQLAERARGWYSPRLEIAGARAAAQSLWLKGPTFAPWVGLAQRVEAELLRIARRGGDRRTGDDLTATVEVGPFRALADEIDALAMDYAHRKAELSALAAQPEDPWMELAWRVLSFAEAVEEDAAAPPDEAEGPERVPIVTVTPGAEALTLVCLDPGRRLGAMLQTFGGVVGLSATLSPPEFHRDALGLPEASTDVVRVPSVFPPEHRRVLVAPRISTALKDRAEHAEATAKLLVAAVGAAPGNAAIYFPSFQMLDDLAGRCTFGREVVVQRPGMDDALREQVLALLHPGGPPTVLLAVLGGVFAEGIDLPSGSLSLVIVVSPALPPVGLERELLRERYERRFGKGFLYASLVPGMTRVVQAAGRLHRREEDRGVILLVDRRFRWREVLELLPADWQPTIEVDPLPAIRAFFTPEE
jgi:DNA excision repair protein ERCC-2